MVSIILPTYKRDIKKTVDSICSQSYADWELIIIEEGSNKVIETDYYSVKEKIIYIHSDDNKGISHARNKGLEVAKGEYIFFIDSDDIWLPTKLEQCVSFMEKRDLDFVFHNYRHIYKGSKNEKIYNKRFNIFSWILASDFAIHTSTVGISRRIINILGINFNEKLTVCEDFNLWWKILSVGSYYCVEDILAECYYNKEDVHLTMDEDLVCECQLKGIKDLLDIPYVKNKDALNRTFTIIHNKVNFKKRKREKDEFES